jgi:hypothetical protein
MEAIARAVPRSTFDPLALLAELDRDPRELARWTRENTTLLPYRGVLRGWKGVLMDRQGNSLDRSLFLGELLALSGKGPIRLAHAQLSAEAAEALLREIRPTAQQEAPTFRSPLEMVEESDFEKHCRRFDVPAGEARDAFAATVLDGQRALEDLAQRVADQTAVVSAGVGPVDGEAQRSREYASAIESLRDHWWVQLETPEGWMDLDVTLSERVRSSGILQPKEILELPRARSPEEEDPGSTLEAELHRLDLRVVIERWRDDEFSRVPLVEASLVPCALVGERIALRHVAPYWPASLDLSKEADPIARLKEIVLEQREWIPVLTVAGDSRIRHSFEPDGTLHDATSPEYVSAFRSWQAGVQGLGDRLGRMLGGESEKEKERPTEKGAVTAEWIEFEFRAPGRPARVVRRTVFDLLSPEERSTGIDFAAVDDRRSRLERGVALLGTTEILLTVNALSPEFVVHESLSGVAAKRPLFTEAARGGFSERSAGLGKLLESGVGREALLTLASCRLGAEARDAGRYVDSPNIVSYWSTFSMDGEETLHHVLAFDFVANGVGVLPREGVDPIQARLRQGVIDTAAEAVLLPLLTSGGSVTDNPSELSVRMSGVTWVPVRSPEDPDWKKIPIPENARAQITEALSEGRLVLLPVGEGVTGKEGNFAWWRIDPRTGDTLGVGRRGWGQTATEYMMASAGSAGFGVATALFWCYRSGSALSSDECQCLIFVNAMLGAVSGPIFLHLTGYTVLMGILTGMVPGEAAAFVGWWSVGTWWIREICRQDLGSPAPGR